MHYRQVSLYRQYNASTQGIYCKYTGGILKYAGSIFWRYTASTQGVYWKYPETGCITYHRSWAEQDGKVCEMVTLTHCHTVVREVFITITPFSCPVSSN